MEASLTALYILCTFSYSTLDSVSQFPMVGLAFFLTFLFATDYIGVIYRLFFIHQIIKAHYSARKKKNFNGEHTVV